MCPLDFKFGLRPELFPHFQPSLLCLEGVEAIPAPGPRLTPHSVLPGKGSGTRGVSHDPHTGQH